MVLAVDIGNTQILIGVFDNDKLVMTSRLSTDRRKTLDEYAATIRSVLSISDIKLADIDGTVISSVVPQLTTVFEGAAAKLFKCNTYVVGPGVKTGLNIKIDNPAQLGSDLVCVSVAALKKYPLPSIVIDMGTATTISALDRNGNMIGVSIMTGVNTALNALFSTTAQLPQINLSGKVNAIGKNTVDSMRSGAVLGNASMIDGMVVRFRQQLGEDATVVATGGLSNVIIPHCVEKITIDENLLIDGLYEIYKKNI